MIRRYFHICKELIRTDLIVFKQLIIDKIVDISIWVILTSLIMGYVMQHFGLSQNFGVFQFAGILSSVGLFELYTHAMELVTDFEDTRTINYALTLPIPSWLAILSKSGYYFITYFLLTLTMLPVGKICLWNQFDLTHIHVGKLLISICASSLFYACFVIWAASIIKNIARLGHIWSRFIFPMWFMGGFEFSWISLYSAFPTLALLNLCNPMIYITEATRGAILSSIGYLNFWICIGVILLFSGLSFVAGIYNLKKRLDFI